MECTLVYFEKLICIEDDFSRDDWSGFAEYATEFRPISLHISDQSSSDFAGGTYTEKLKLEFDLSDCVVWLVVVRYTDGDTFGCTHGNWKIQGVFKTEKEAEDVKKQIEDGTLPKPKYIWNDREQEGVHPWDSYFASLDSVEIHKMKVD